MNNIMTLIKGFNLGLRFLLEVSFICCLIYSGFKTERLGSFRYLIAFVLPALIIWFWSLYMAPASPQHFIGFKKFISEIIIFYGSLIAIYITGNIQATYVLGIASTLHLLLLYTIGG